MLAERESAPVDDELINMATSLREKIAEFMDETQLNNALAEIFKVISRANKYIDETTPWILGKDESKKARLASVLYNLLEAIRISTTLLSCFMPTTMPKVWEQIGADKELITYENAGKFNVLPLDVTVHKGPALFPRIDADKEIEELNELIKKQAEEAQKQIACFSEQNNSTLMWGHYADSHKGFCLEYDFQSILKECTQNCIDIRCCNNFMLNYSLAPIIYTKERFDATAYFSTVMQALLYEKNQIPMDLYYEDILIVSKCMLTKSIDWEYENEWRLFTPNFNDEYKPYRKIASLRPVALYMGAKITKENESVLYEVCKNKGIKCFKMLQDFHGKEFIVRAEPYEKIIDVVNSNFHDK